MRRSELRPALLALLLGAAGCRGGDSGSEAVRARRHLDDRLGRQKGSQRSQQNQQ